MMGLVVLGVQCHMNQLSAEQKKKLLKNSNIEKITNNHVIFKPSFKIRAVELYLDGENPEDIFTKASIPIHYFQDRYCDSCLKRWKKKFLEQGPEGLDSDRRGTGTKSGRPRKPTYEELEALVAIQREALGYAKK